jgi:hypothetical protein
LKKLINQKMLSKLRPRRKIHQQMLAYRKRK